MNITMALAMHSGNSLTFYHDVFPKHMPYLPFPDLVDAKGPFQWTAACHQAFEQQKGLCFHVPTPSLNSLSIFIAMQVTPSVYTPGAKNEGF
jgi:hypothetical protein